MMSQTRFRWGFPADWSSLDKLTFIMMALSGASVMYLYQRLLDPHDQPSFTTYFPGYYRAAGLIVFGIWCWGINVQVLSRIGVNMNAVLQTDPANYTDFGYKSIFAVASVYTFVYTVNLALFAYMLPSTFKEPVSLSLPTMLYVSYVALLFAPVRHFGVLRATFANACWRILRAPFVAVSFADIILADIFTSFAKVFGDMETTACLIAAGGAAGAAFNVSCARFAPLIMSLPSLWRFLQCLRQFRDERLPRHLFNALKYSTAFPVIFLSAAQHASPNAVRFEVWLLAVCVNTLYSFYWDIVYDWDLGRRDAAHPFLRNSLLFEKPMYYYAAMAINLMLRCTWSIKLSTHINLNPDVNLLLLEGLEVIRRTIWIFLRVEHQLARDNILPLRKHSPLNESVTF